MVTPEMLLFLARRVGLWVPGIVDERVEYAIPTLPGIAVYEPHNDDAQFGQLVVWAAMQGLEPMLAKRHAFAGLVGTSSDYTQSHDSTPDSIRSAAVVAICRALGYEGEKE